MVSDRDRKGSKQRWLLSTKILVAVKGWELQCWSHMEDWWFHVATSHLDFGQPNWGTETENQILPPKPKTKQEEEIFKKEKEKEK